MMSDPEWLTPTVVIFETIVKVVFGFWPVFLFSPVVGGKNKKPLLPSFLATWCVLGLLRVIILFIPELITPSLLPEPYNTIVFIAVGMGLFGIYLAQKFRYRHQFDRRTGRIRTVSDLMELSPAEFEEMVVDLYSAAGHRVRRTGKTGDHGVDVVVEAKNGEKWIVQCKRWRGTVGEPIVRDFHGVLQHEKAHRGILITSGKFSRPALAWARGKPLSLYDGENFLQLWQRAKAQSRQQRTTNKPPTPTPG